MRWRGTGMSNQREWRLGPAEGRGVHTMLCLWASRRADIFTSGFSTQRCSISGLSVAGTFGSILVSGRGKWKKFQARFPLPGGNTDAFLLAVCDSLAKSAATAKIKPASLKMHEAGKPHFIAFYSGCSSSAMGYLSFFFFLNIHVFIWNRDQVSGWQRWHNRTEQTLFSLLS